MLASWDSGMNPVKEEVPVAGLIVQPARQAPRRSSAGRASARRRRDVARRRRRFARSAAMMPDHRSDGGNFPVRRADFGARAASRPVYSRASQAEESMNDGELYPEIEPFERGLLDLDGRHRMYWEQSGNPDG